MSCLERRSGGRNISLKVGLGRGRVESRPMKEKTHFAFRIDVWDQVGKAESHARPLRPQKRTKARSWVDIREMRLQDR